LLALALEVGEQVVERLAVGDKERRLREVLDRLLARLAEAV
jgi:hypothetical protein